MGNVDQSNAANAGVDPILQRFLHRNFDQAMALAASSDILDLVSEPTPPGLAPSRYIAAFHCKGFIHDGRGNVGIGDTFLVGIWFPPDFLVAPPNVAMVLTSLPPSNIWHPNVAGTLICCGRLTAGTALVEILYQLYEMLSWQKIATHDPLNAAAAQWAQSDANRGRYPVDRRPLKRRAVAAKGNAA